jgi:hypothetical protein
VIFSLVSSPAEAISDDSHDFFHQLKSTQMDQDFETKSEKYPQENYFGVDKWRW